MLNGLSPGRTGDHRILELGGALEIYILYLYCTDHETKDQRELMTPSKSQSQSEAFRFLASTCSTISQLCFSGTQDS